MKGNISTRTGDKGSTIIGGGERVSKTNIRIHCLGDLDEANSFLGLLRTKLTEEHDWQKPLQEIQTELMNLMGHIATPSSAKQSSTTPLPEEGAERMEAWMKTIEESLESTTEYFLLPGGTDISALCHVVRTVIRRAERSLVQLHEEDPVDPSILIYVNRLSDLMFKLAREESHRSGVTEERWRLFQPNKDSDA